MSNYPFVRDPFTVIDGGLSTALELLGADISGPLWTAQTVIDDPALLERAHRSFVEAGADIIATASYQCGTKQFEAIGKWSNEKIMETYIKINGEYRNCQFMNNWMKK